MANDEKEITNALAERSGISTENFKIELQGLPKFFGVSQAKKLLTKNKLDFHKVKPCGKNATYMFINFKSEEGREKALNVLNGITVKGKTIRAIPAKAVKDPMLKRLEQAAPEVEDNRTVFEKVCDAVCPLAQMPYEDQIKKKTDMVKSIMDSLRAEVVKNLKFVPNQDELRLDDIAVVEPFIPSPVLNGYRNKCEFSVGYHPEHPDQVTVGFRLASYKKGSLAVVGVEDLPIVSDRVSAVQGREKMTLF